METYLHKMSVFFLGHLMILNGPHLASRDKTSWRSPSFSKVKFPRHPLSFWPLFFFFLLHHVKWSGPEMFPFLLFPLSASLSRNGEVGLLKTLFPPISAASEVWTRRSVSSGPVRTPDSDIWQTRPCQTGRTLDNRTFVYQTLIGLIRQDRVGSDFYRIVTLRESTIFTQNV